MKKGKFIVFEGIDGSGKTTQCSLLHKNLINSNIPCLLTHEPHNGVIGSFIRNLLHSHFSQSHISPAILSYLFAADRYEHVYGENGIESHLTSGKHVICDRYIYSSLAYQGSPPYQKHVETINACFPKPDIVIYLEIDISQALLRIKRKKDLMESKDFLSSIKERYTALFSKQEYDNASTPFIYTVDASQNKEITAENILAYVRKLL